MVERSRGKVRNALEGGSVEVRKFHQGEVGRDAEDALGEVDEQNRGNRAAEDDVDGAGEECREKYVHLEAVSEQKLDGERAGKGDERFENAPDELRSVADSV